MVSLRQQGTRLVSCLLAAVLACSLGGACPGAAWASPADDGSAAVSSARKTLDSAEARMSEINAEYEALTAQIDELQKQIDANTAAALAAQEAMLQGREALSKVVVGEYRDGGSNDLLMMVLDSKTFADLLRNVEYAEQIMSFQADEVQRQRDRKAAFDEVSATLNDQRNQQEEALAAQEEKRAEAQALVEEAESELADAKAEHAARLKELAAQAKAMEAAAEKEEQGSGVVQGADTVNRQDVVPDSAPVKPNPKPKDEEKPAAKPDSSGGNVSDKPSSSGSSSSSSGSSGSSGSGSTGNGGWMTGIASAYGGSTDPYTPNPGTTATGALCDDYSMGVAVPMAQPGYRKLFNRGVEISWNGKTVYAVVNDCGYMGGGSRVLDLQPGVWKVFGFSSCRDWGLRTVNYRFL